MLAAVLAIPMLIRGLGAPRFGVLTLAWAVIGYFSLFDFGLGRALTQAVASRVSARDDAGDLAAVTTTALTLMLALGVMGGMLLAALAPRIVAQGLHVPPSLAGETVTVLYLLALSLPFVLTTAGLRGLMEAHQDFGVATALRLPLALLNFIGPLAVLPFSTSLVPIVAMLVGGRVLTWMAHAVVCVKRYDYLSTRLSVTRSVVVPLLRSGGWMTASNIVSPLMVYVDRFFISATMPLAAVAHYVTPYELVTKLLTLPASFIGAFFPAFASTYAVDRAQTSALFERSVRALALLMFPLLLVVVLFAEEGLSAWVGHAFALESAPVLRWLAIGVYLNSIAQAPFAVMQGTGRPDLAAKLHLLELPLYATGLWWLAGHYGIVGVAMAWTFRVAIDTAALLALAIRRLPDARHIAERSLLTVTGSLLVLAIAALMQAMTLKISFVIAAAVLFPLIAWRGMLHPAERASLVAWGEARRSRA